MRILALSGSYREGGTIDRTIDAILEAAQADGADVRKIRLLDQHLEFCTNCRACTQAEGEAPGRCVQEDDMKALLDAIDEADAIVLGSPMNFGTVTAVTKRFIERLVCFAYWPWGAAAPKNRSRARPKRAVVVASSQAPRVMTLLGGYVKLLKDAVKLMRAKPIGVVYIGMAAMKGRQEIKARTLRRAHRLGRQLAAP